MEGFMNFLGVFITGIVITRIIITIQMMKQYKKIQQQRQQQTSSINDSDAIKQPQGEMIYRPVDIEMVQDHVTGKQISKLQSYQLVRDDKIYYFSTWEDREDFIHSTKKQEKDLDEE